MYVQYIYVSWNECACNFTRHPYVTHLACNECVWMVPGTFAFGNRAD